VIEIAEDLRLRGESFGPHPLLLELFRKLVGVFHALDVAVGAGIAVPKPRAADAAPRLENLHGKSETA
jgi:hypothetical protein